VVELSTGVSPLGERDGGIVDWSFFIGKGVMVELSTGVFSTVWGWWNGRPELLEWLTYCTGMVM
jgi:hypothetical protein